ncbi:MAG: hypothetical protein MZU79_02450 [Anaerotruncus sp.]|nr:hypothetical protein [Anaerotruncus sp.]
MQRNGYKLLKLINNLLDLSKAEAGKLRLKLKTVNVVEFIPPLLASVKPLADQKQLRLYCQSPPSHRTDHRPGPVREGRLQPAVERPEVYEQGRQGHRLRRGQGTLGHLDRRGHRHRHPREHAGDDLCPVLPGRRLEVPGPGGHGHRPGPGQGDRPRPSGHHPGRERARPGVAVHRRDAEGRRPFRRGAVDSVCSRLSP